MTTTIATGAMTVLERLTDPVDETHRSIRASLLEARAFIEDAMHPERDEDKANALLHLSWNLEFAYEAVDEALAALDEICPRGPHD